MFMLVILVLLGTALSAPNQSGRINHLNPNDTKAIEDEIDRFINVTGVPGLSIAIAHNNQLMYRAGFGCADPDKLEKMTPNNTLRIGSVSKQITMLTILKLADQGYVNLGQKVFGRSGILGDIAKDSPCSRNLLGVLTVRHLVNHMVGGWSDYTPDSPDPLELLSLYDVGPDDRPWTKDTLTKAGVNSKEFCLSKQPGTIEKYSNFGYFLLGQIVEKVTKKSYIDAVNKAIFQPMGIRAAEVSSRTKEGRSKFEVTYSYPKDPKSPYTFLPDIEAADGGWAMRPTDLVKMGVHVGGYGAKPSLIRSSLLKEFKIGKGFDYGHDGSVEGTFATIQITNTEQLGNFVFAVAVNGEPEGNAGTNNILGHVEGFEWPEEGTDLGKL